jgi:hypothetical protein
VVGDREEAGDQSEARDEHRRKAAQGCEGPNGNLRICYNPVTFITNTGRPLGELYGT